MRSPVPGVQGRCESSAEMKYRTDLITSGLSAIIPRPENAEYILTVITRYKISR